MEVVQPKVKYFLGCKLTRANLILLVGGLVFVLVALLARINPKYDIHWNLSESIKATFFIVDKTALPNRGDYAAFNYYDFTAEAYKLGIMDTPPKVVFIKQVVGVAGDVVSQKNREFFVNGQSVGVAKVKSKKGRLLKANEFEGVIPFGFYYVYTPHKDSYDSRYADVGLIPVKEVKGKAYAY